MIRSIRSLMGFAVMATDGEVGRLRYALFESEHWAIRYLVSERPHWWARHRRLLSPHAVRGINAPARAIELSLSMEAVDAAPALQEGRPVTREWEEAYADRYRWPYYWSGGDIWGMMSFPGAMLGGGSPPDLPMPFPPSKEPRLRAELSGLLSTREVRGFRVERDDQVLGEVSDFLFDDESWVIRGFLVPGVGEIAPEAVAFFGVDDRRITLRQNRSVA